MMKYEGKPVSDLIMMIFRTNGRIVRAGDELLEDLNLSGSRWQVLGAVKQTPRTVAQIARLYELSRQRVLWHVQALIADGVVELVDNPEHRRAKLVKFTDGDASCITKLNVDRNAGQASWLRHLNLRSFRWPRIVCVDSVTS